MKIKGENKVGQTDEFRVYSENIVDQKLTAFYENFNDLTKHNKERIKAKIKTYVFTQRAHPDLEEKILLKTHIQHFKDMLDMSF